MNAILGTFTLLSSMVLLIFGFGIYAVGILNLVFPPNFSNTTKKQSPIEQPQFQHDIQVPITMNTTRIHHRSE